MVASGVLDLVERFTRNRDDYRSGRYNETQLRREFLDPFFEALGWDVNNRQGYAEAYKDVIHEDAIKIGGYTKAPDYCFRIGGTRKFFVEAKKPSVNLRFDTSPAFQLRRYAWSAKLPLSILTDFEEFAVYDCRIRPVQTDKASTARILYVPYTDYAERWDEIARVFSRDAILKGSFDAYAESSKAKRGTAEVDAAFLKEIESWRESLARNLALRNPGLTQRQLNFAVQMTIDRIIFLRMAEDRGIEEYGRLLALRNGGSVYDRLRELFVRADERYNSGLFHFHQERDRTEPPDDLTPGLTIDDRPLKEIIKSLYYPDSPYEFAVLPVAVLGQVYEQFLGKVITLTSRRKVEIEEKPEVRKAGGVYYTPTYIVDYIVEHTVGKLLEGKKPGPRGSASKLKILDPACGSGSFLLGAYQYLLDWHRDRYVEDGPEKHTKELYQGHGGQWLLTTQEKKRILLNNIYGVDIDPQAVEVTKLSLLLKVLEGESEQSLVRQLTMFHERALPDLSKNIKCGNSLIGPDFYDNAQMSFLSEEEQYRINVFDWNKEYSEIMKAGGFDAVIGNPPYLNIDDTWGTGDPRQRYIRRAFSAVYNDKTDILFYFLAKAISISKGEIGFIVSRAFREAYKADKLRAWMAEKADIREIVDFRNYYVFKGVGITTAIIIASKREAVSTARVYELRTTEFVPGDLDKQIDSNAFELIPVDQETFGSAAWVFARQDLDGVNQKIDSVGKPLGSVLFIGQGMQTGRNSVFGKLDRSRVQEWTLEENQYFIRARNSDISRYLIRDSGELLLYLEDVERFESLPRAVQDYLNCHEAELKERAAYKRGDCDWWRYTWPLHKEQIRRPKLYSPYLATHNRFALDETQEFLGLTDTTVLYDAGQPEHLRYLLGLLNSRLLTFRFRFIGKLKSNAILEYFWNSISKLPVRRIDFSNPSDKAQHDQMVSLVERILELHKRLAAAKIAHEKTMIQRQIEATDRQIDRLVYELYGLTDEEIAIVEEATER